MRVRRPLSVRSKLLASAALAGLLLAAVGAVVHSAFTSTVRNDGNFFQAGTVGLDGNFDRATALFDLRELKPGPVGTRCVRVVYHGGDLVSTVRMYGETDGSLQDHLDVEVTRGRFEGAVPSGGSCAGFVADPGDPLFDGSLASFPSSYAAGVVDPDGAWSDGEAAAYRIAVDLDDIDRAQGLAVTQAFVFEARTD